MTYKSPVTPLQDVPGDLSVLEKCEPVYETLPGWTEPTAGVRVFNELPEAARRYLDRLSELSGVEIGIVSTGPDRDHTIVRGQSALSSWFA